MRFEPEKPTAEQIRLYREEHGAGITEAKKHFMKIAMAEVASALPAWSISWPIIATSSARW